jgi:hypothetical protein
MPVGSIVCLGQTCQVNDVVRPGGEHRTDRIFSGQVVFPSESVISPAHLRGFRT